LAAAFHLSTVLSRVQAIRARIRRFRRFVVDSQSATKGMDAKITLLRSKSKPHFMYVCLSVFVPDNLKRH